MISNQSQNQCNFHRYVSKTKIHAYEALALCRSCQKSIEDWFQRHFFIFSKIRWRGSLIIRFCTFFTIWGVSWQTAKMRAHFIAQSERGKNSSQTRPFFVVWDSYLAASLIKVFVYKSSGELAISISAINLGWYRVVISKHWKFTKITLYLQRNFCFIYQYKLNAIPNSTWNVLPLKAKMAETSQNFRLYFIKKAHRRTLLKRFCI